MKTTTAIEWTDVTWNPVTGCTPVSSGCDNCYARTLARGRLARVYLKRLPVVTSPENVADPFAVRLWPERLTQPAALPAPSMVFVNSMSDVFHHEVPEVFVRKIFAVMLREERHVYQVLTKRPARALRFFTRNRDLFPAGRIPGHIWMGTSIENQAAAFRSDHLRRVPAEVRFLSCEPLLGPLQIDLSGIHWVIVGGESGAVHRRMDLDWARGVRDQCLAAGIAFFFKQVGGRTPKEGGRLLDGREWNETPMGPSNHPY